MRQLGRTLCAWFTGRRFHDELAEEMELHLSLRGEKLRAGGLTEEDARLEAKRRFGSTLRTGEEAREAWGARWFDTLRQDAGYALRGLRANRIFSVAAILTLTVGIGANTALFALIDALILRPLPIADPGQLALLAVRDRLNAKQSADLSYPVFEAMRQRTRTLDGLFARTGSQYLLGTGSEAHRATGAAASGAYYQTLGRAPALGRFFSVADDTPQAQPVAVLSYAAWQRYFGGARTVIGQVIRLDKQPFTVIGVEPQDFPNLLPGTITEVTIPIHAQAALHPHFKMLETPGVFFLSVFGRLKPGATLPEANAEMKALTNSILESVHLRLATMDLWGLEKSDLNAFGVVSGTQGNRLMTQQYDKPLFVLISISAMVLGIGCLNLANLLLARALARRRELAVRMALGASGGRVIRQLLTESLLLAIVSAVFGALLAYGLTVAAGRYLPVQASPDWRILSFLAALSVLVALSFGIVPALRSVTFGAQALKGARTVGHGRAGARLNRTIVTIQVALSVMLICSAFLFEKSFRALLNQDAGFDRSHLVFTEISTAEGTNGEHAKQFLRDLLRAARTTPGVASAAVTNIVPLEGGFMWYAMPAKLYPQLPEAKLRLFGHRVSPGYFETLKIPLVAGRDFSDSDGAAKPRIGVLSEKAAALYFPGRPAVGQFLKMDDNDEIRIVGIVKDARYQNIREPAPPTLYTNFESGQFDSTSGVSWQVLLRTNLALNDVAATLGRLVQHGGGAVSMSPPLSLNQTVESSIATDRLLTMAATSFAVLGGLLAAVGLCGIMAYSVAQRTNEIGVRLALGALRGDVVWAVLSETLALAAIGIAAGIALGLLSGKLIANLLYQTSATDPASFIYTALTIALLAIVAGLLPALRASRIDPMVALRYE